MPFSGTDRFAMRQEWSSTGSWVLLLFVLLTSCKKESGIHCPYVELDQRSPSVDLSPVTNIPEIMDTLKKYSEMKPTAVYSNYNVDGFNATVRANVYSDGLIIFNHGYTLWYPPLSDTSIDRRQIIPRPSVSHIPDFSGEKAVEIARNKSGDLKCSYATLGLISYEFVNRTDPSNYKLIWRIVSIDDNAIVAEIDAHTGEIYNYNQFH
jgi:hypothetical protein